jgi:hypothetical protein
LIPTDKVRISAHIIGIDTREPMLYVDVNLGNSGSQRIVVYDGDKAEDLARDFAQKFNLDAQMQMKLAVMLQ